MLVLITLLAWSVGRLVGDRWLWSQYLSWTPTPVAVAVALAGLPVSWLAGTLAMRAIRAAPASLTRRVRRRTPARWTRRAAFPFLAIAIMWLVFADLGLHRTFRSHPPSTHRLVYLNAGSLDIEPARAALAALNADTVVIANPRLGAPLGRLTADLRAAVSPDDPDAAHARIVGLNAIVSRHPIGPGGHRTLGLQDAPSGTRSTDPGRATFVTLEPTEAPAQTQALTVWIVDLPRDTSARRPVVMRTARDAIDAWRDPRALVRGTRTDDQGRTIAVLGDTAPDSASNTPADAPRGFPEPGLIVGDFNTPRGARSLRALAGTDHHSAFDQAGVGWAGTFPREQPLAAIDLAFTGPGWRATGFRAVDLGAGYHRAIVVDIAPN